ncbi:hypothetical protein PanWU01x14_344490 [Parasponia andersonii]|uniref:Uncharacterized protein n=1 Tax=Parasponia andersonii TaxID=3476 RepID=A0A2P5AD27_PARAD|nr:hypothetical protein PanWU01x14_344490 [Parasponia andersonii]
MSAATVGSPYESELTKVQMPTKKNTLSAYWPEMNGSASLFSSAPARPFSLHQVNLLIDRKREPN